VKERERRGREIDIGLNVVTRVLEASPTNWV
jgi:hypothetical protein